MHPLTSNLSEYIDMTDEDEQYWRDRLKTCGEVARVAPARERAGQHPKLDHVGIYRVAKRIIDAIDVPSNN